MPSSLFLHANVFVCRLLLRVMGMKTIRKKTLSSGFYLKCVSSLLFFLRLIALRIGRHPRAHSTQTINIFRDDPFVSWK